MNKSSPLINRVWTPTRDTAMARLRNFIPKAGVIYAHERNYDYGTEYNSVSCLSPYISRRMLTEDEIIKEVLSQHTYSSAEKFIQEVLWRVYWKGWLEMHPSVWTEFRVKLLDHVSSCSSEPQYQKAITGSTGIDCFDAWVNELIQTGYLHNHARMWFSSIWIFTLKLPWELGAHFFYSHLLDADPASNTLSWRWVAGLQTRGKYYLATRENIKKYTKNRFSPIGLSEEIPSIESEACDHPLVSPRVYPEIPDSTFSDTTLTIIFEEDLHLESLPGLIDIASKSHLMIITNTLLGQEYGISFSNVVKNFSEGAIQDFEKRISGFVNNDFFRPKNYLEIASFLFKHSVKHVIYIQPHIGYGNDLLQRLQKEVNGTFHPIRRKIDKELYPYASKGFFNFKKSIPEYVKASINSIF